MIAPTSSRPMLRCLCNLGVCEPAKGMCKSRVGCFQELRPAAHARSGCLELWPDYEPFACAPTLLNGSHVPPKPRRRRETLVEWRRSSQSKLARALRRETVSLRCCAEDVCNYVAPHRLSTTTPELPETPSASRIWLRVGLIATPLIGAAAVVLLVLLAASLLRADRRRVDGDHDGPKAALAMTPADPTLPVDVSESLLPSQFNAV